MLLHEIHRGVLKCSREECNIDISLSCGQSFRWREKNPREWWGVLGDWLWKLRQDGDAIHYEVYAGQGTQGLACNNPVEVLKDYFQLDTNLKMLYQLWSARDKNFQEKSKLYIGVRILRQEPIENVFSFICSSNNNIARISKMVSALCSEFGKPIGKMDAETWYRFPDVDSLAREGVEEKLRKFSFGYRAKYIVGSAQMIAAYPRGADSLKDLRTKSYAEAKLALMKLPGVGPKVADCVCLMSLDKPGAIPVDTHVWQVAKRDYMAKLLGQKSLTSSLYLEIGDFFRQLHGPYAGWCHSILFTADLKKFKSVATEDSSSAEKRKTVGVESRKIAKKQKP